MGYRVRVNATSGKRADEVRILLKKYSEANYSLGQMGVSVQTWDAGDRRNMPDDIAPIRIRGELLKVHIDSAACVGGLARAMREEEPYRNVNPRETCIEALELARSVLARGSILNISKMTLPSDMPNLYKLRASGMEPVIFPELEIVAILLAHQLESSDFDRLFRGEADADLTPV